MRILYLSFTFLLFFNCSSQVEKKNKNVKPTVTEQKKQVQPIKYRFEFSDKAYTEHKINDFHHIRIISEYKIHNDNINEVKAAINKEREVVLMVKKLNDRIKSLNLPDSISQQYSVEFRDNLYKSCQVHRTSCIMRYYEIVREQKGKKRHLDLIDKNEVLINGLSVNNISKDSLIQKIGEPNSIIPPDTMNLDVEEFTYYKYNNAEFYSINRETTFFVDYINTNSDFKITISNKEVNELTTIEEFKDLFPLSYLNLEKDTYKTGNYDSRIRVRIMTSEGYEEEGAFLFDFKDGKLIKFTYHVLWT